jgi:hypothetical protein
MHKDLNGGRAPSLTCVSPNGRDKRKLKDGRSGLLAAINIGMISGGSRDRA